MCLCSPEAIVANKKIPQSLLDGQWLPSKKRRIDNQPEAANTVVDVKLRLDVGFPNNSSSNDCVLPVFQDENDRIAFHRSLQIDLGPLVDHMFTLHTIDQEVDWTVAATRSRPRPKVSVYSCQLCQKVFKSPSHVRLHCLVHTDLKPFKCFRCNYTTNTRGWENIYISGFSC